MIVDEDRKILDDFSKTGSLTYLTPDGTHTSEQRPTSSFLKYISSENEKGSVPTVDVGPRDLGKVLLLSIHRLRTETDEGRLSSPSSPLPSPIPVVGPLVDETETNPLESSDGLGTLRGPGHTDRVPSVSPPL